MLPAIEAAVKGGDVSAAHVDAATRALRQVPETRRGELAAIVDRRVGDARSLPANEFEKRLKVEVRRLQGDDEARQKRSIRWRSWVERISGMFRGDFACDPLNTVKIDKRIQDEVDRLFAERVPDECPDDPIEKQKYLAGLAVISLLLGNGGGGESPSSSSWSMRLRSMRTASPPSIGDSRSTCLTMCWPSPARAKVHMVAVWPPADLDLGRRQRLASAAQRRVLRALYRRVRSQDVRCGSVACGCITSGGGSTAARPTSTTSCRSAAVTTTRSTTAGGT